MRRLRSVGVSPVSAAVAAMLEQTAQRLGLRQGVQILQSTLTQVPVVIGYLRPVILLPASVLTGVPSAQLQAILAHELAHVRRHDFLVNLLQTLVETVFFYHPGVWWLSHRIRVERENCCDDLAVAALGNRVEYGRALLAIEELRSPATALALSVRTGSLLDRVRRLFVRSPVVQPLSAGNMVGLGLLALALIGVGVWVTAIAGERDAAMGATATLEDGVQVTLLGVSYQPSEGQPWWKPDGGPLAGDPLAARSKYSQTHVQEADGERRELALEITGSDLDVHAWVDFAPGDKLGLWGTYWDFQEDAESAKKTTLIRAATAAFPKGAKQGDVLVRLAAAPWHPYQVIDLTQEPPPAAEDQEDGTVQWRRIQERTDGTTQVDILFPEKFELRAHHEVAAEDVDGNPVDLYGVTVGEAGARGLIFRCPRERLAQVRVRFRWYTHKVTFRKVSLDPGRMTQVKAEVERLEPPEPEPYAAELPGGLTVEFVGITRNTFPASEGWKPNGRPLGDSVGYWPSTIVLHSENTSSSYVENGPHPEPDADAIDFLFRIRGLKSQPSIAFDLPTSGSSYSHLPVKDPYELRVSARRRSESRPGAPGSPPDGQLHVGLTDEPWSRYVRIGLDGKLLDPIQPDEPYAATHKLVEVLGAQPNERISTGTAILMREPSGHADPANPWHRYAFEFRAIDTDGNEHWAIEWESQGIEGTSLVNSQRGLAEPLPAGKTLSHYEYRLRPYRHWVTFERVSLQPGETTEVQVKVESSPNLGDSLALIEVSATDALTFDGRAMRMGEIDAALRRAGFDPATTTIVIRGHPNATYRVISELVAALRDAGWTRFTLGPTESAALVDEALRRFDESFAAQVEAAELESRKLLTLSPDLDQLALVRDGDLFVLEARTGQVAHRQKVGLEVDAVAWTKDGLLVLFADGRVVGIELPVRPEAMKDLQGTWELTGLVVNGTKVTVAGQDMKVVVKDDQLTYFYAGKDETNRAEFRIALVSGTNPAEIDATSLNGIGPLKGQVYRGIYEQKDDDLWICLPDEPSVVRPSKPQSTAGSQLQLLVLRRMTTQPRPADDQPVQPHMGQWRGPAAIERIAVVKPVFGEWQHGVELGISYSTEQRQFRSGERIPLELFIRNVSKEQVEIEFIPDFFSNVPGVQNATGEKMPIESIHVLFEIPRLQATLKPGEALGVRHFGLGLGENPLAEQGGGYPFWQAPPPGKYTLRFGLDIGVKSIGESAEPTRATFTAGPLEFEVLEGRAAAGGQREETGQKEDVEEGENGDARATVEQALGKKVSLSVSDRPLIFVLDQLEREHGVRITISLEEVHARGVDEHAQATADLKDVSLRDAFEHVLSLVGLTFGVTEAGIVIPAPVHPDGSDTTEAPVVGVEGNPAYRVTICGLNVSRYPSTFDKGTLPGLLVPDPEKPGQKRWAANLLSMPIYKSDPYATLDYPVGSGHFFVSVRQDQRTRTYGPIDGDPFDLLGLDQAMHELLKGAVESPNDALLRLRQLLSCDDEKLCRRGFSMIQELPVPVDRRSLDGLIEVLEEVAAQSTEAQFRAEVDAALARVRDLKAQSVASWESRRVLLEDTEYAAGNDSEPSPQIVWGEPHADSGLQVGFGLYASPDSRAQPDIQGFQWPFGDALLATVFVRAQGDAPVKITSTSRADEGLRLWLVDESGERHECGIGTLTTLLQEQRFRLSKGQWIELKQLSLTATELLPGIDESRFHGGFLVPAGQYSLQVALTIAGFESGGSTGPITVPAAGEWTGELISGSVPVSVVAADAVLEDDAAEGAERPAIEAPAVSDAVRELLDRANKELRGPFRAARRYETNDQGHITGLSLREFQLRAGDAQAIGELTQLTHLDLSHTNVSDADLKELTPLASLRDLNLWETEITDTGATTLSTLTTLESLQLGGTRITDAALAPLGELRQLRYLDIARCQITDAGMEALLNLPNLASLKLSETEITDSGLRTLEDLPALRGVTLDETQVTAEGLARFSQHGEFQWMATEEGVAQELAGRVSAADQVGVEAMLAIGLELPNRGHFQAGAVTPHPVTPKDIERQSRRFRVEWDWTVDGKEQVLFAELSIRQGSAKVTEAGIIEPPNEAGN